MIWRRATRARRFRSCWERVSRSWRRRGEQRLELAQDQASATAAAHLLASEPDYITEKNTDQRRSFPYNFIMRVEVPDFD
jgi:hypothetical protein